MNQGKKIYSLILYPIAFKDNFEKEKSSQMQNKFSFQKV